MRNPWEIAREIGIAIISSVGVDVLFHKMKGEAADAVVKTIKKKLNDESRAEMLTFICELAGHDEPQASENLLRRQRERQNEAEISYKPGVKYPPGSEDEFVTLLTKLYIALSDDEREKESRIEMFARLGNMSDEDFDATLKFLDHDIAMQYIRKGLYILGLTVKEVMDLLKELGANEAIRKADSFIGGEMKKINDNLESNWWVRSSHKKKCRRFVLPARRI